MTQLSFTEFLTQQALKSANQTVRVLWQDADQQGGAYDYEEEDHVWHGAADEIEDAKLWS